LLVHFNKKPFEYSLGVSKGPLAPQFRKYTTEYIMTIDYLLDFTAYLPQKQCPRLHEVQTFLNCCVTDLPRGNMIIQQQFGKFLLKVYDNEKGKGLENRVVKYFLPGDKEGKNPIPVKIVKKPEMKRYVNPKYVNVFGVYESELAEYVTNEHLTKLFSKYGTILVPVQDVHDLSENVWATDKKNFRIDFDKEMHIPRKCPIEYTTPEGKTMKPELRVTYKDQPRFCRQCVTDHTGDCPLWLERQKRMQEIKEQKEKDTKTLVMGDSNLKQVNSNALLADVVASSGAKIGHLANQLKHEKLEGYNNIVIFAGINNIPAPVENVSEVAVWKQISKELDALEDLLVPQAKKGKNIYLTHVAKARHTNTPRAVSLRQKINKRYVQMATNLKKVNKRAQSDVITWPVTTNEDEGNETVKGISEQATVEYIRKVCEKVGNDKIRATYLDSKLTARPYSSVTTTYPLGCYKCTEMNHSAESCPLDLTKKRQASSDLELQHQKVQVTNNDEAL